MTPALPSLEEPEPGSVCPDCLEPIRLAAPTFCASCFEKAMLHREAPIRAQLAEAKRRARTWHLGRAVQA